MTDTAKERTYITRDGDMLDGIAAKEYPGRTGAETAIAEANRSLNLGAIGVILPAGLALTLPAMPEAETSAVIRLWGEA